MISGPKSCLELLITTTNLVTGNLNLLSVIYKKDRKKEKK